MPAMIPFWSTALRWFHSFLKGQDPEGTIREKTAPHFDLWRAAKLHLSFIKYLYETDVIGLGLLCFVMLMTKFQVVPKVQWKPIDAWKQAWRQTNWNPQKRIAILRFDSVLDGQWSKNLDNPHKPVTVSAHLDPVCPTKRSTGVTAHYLWGLMSLCARAGTAFPFCFSSREKAMCVNSPNPQRSNMHLPPMSW